MDVLYLNKYTKVIKNKSFFNDLLTIKLILIQTKPKVHQSEVR